MSLIHWIPLINNFNDVAGGAASAAVSPTILPTTLTNGKLGRGYSFKNNGIKIKSVQLSAEMSFSVWVKLANNTACHIIDARSSSGEVGYQPMYYNGSGIQIYSSAGGGNDYINCSLDTSWHLLVATIKDGIGTLFLDGQKKGTKTVTPLSSLVDMTIGCRLNGANPCEGVIQDVRVYDHALSLLEIKQLNQALAIHYDFNEPLIESTVNYATYPTPMANIATKYSWDSSLHANAIQVKGWSEGYNGGVSSPTTGYHAMWQELEDIPTIVFTNLNTTSRWLGINGEIGSATKQLLPGATITISYDAKSDRIGPGVSTGLYHYVTGSTSQGWHSGNTLVQATTTEWKRYQNVINVSSTFDTSKAALIYIYGNNKGQGISYVRNIQLEINDHATPYARSSKESMLCNAVGTVQPSQIIDMSYATTSAIGTYSASFNGDTSGIEMPCLKEDMFISDYTLSFWVYPLDNGRAVYFGDYGMTNTSGINFERKADGTFRYYHNGSPDWGSGKGITTENTWTMLTVTYTPGKLTLYKNGVEETSLNHTATLTKNINSAVRIGRDSRTLANSGETPFKGYMNDFRFYCSCLSKEEVEELYSTKGMISDCGDCESYEIIEDKENFQLNYKSQLETNSISEFNNSYYTPLEYIESNGTQYIDTGYYWTSEKATIVADLAVTTWKASSTIFGSEERYSGTSRYFAHILHAGSANGSYANYIGEGNSGTTTLSLGTRSVIEYIAHGDKTFSTKVTNSSGTTTYVNKASYTGSILTHQNSTQTAENKGNIYIFANHNAYNGTDGIQKMGGMKLYRFTMYDNDICVRDFIPCKRKSDNIAGLLDLTSGQFYVSPTGNFIHGPETILDETFEVVSKGLVKGRNFIEY